MNDQLDAWQQLYLLACVKMWFISYWDPNEFTSSDELWSEPDSGSEGRNESGSEAGNEAGAGAGKDAST